MKLIKMTFEAKGMEYTVDMVEKLDPLGRHERWDYRVRHNGREDRFPEAHWSISEIIREMEKRK